MDEAFNIIAAFYPSQMIEPKTQFGLEEIFDLTVESPTAFRRRMIFISHNALDRPRMNQTASRDETIQAAAESATPVPTQS